MFNKIQNGSTDIVFLKGFYQNIIGFNYIVFSESCEQKIIAFNLYFPFQKFTPKDNIIPPM